MTKEIILAILSSSILTAVITTLFQFAARQKEYNVEHITNERKNWREYLREIAVDINAAASKADLSDPLSRLKTRINAYGYLNMENYLMDGHVWQLIAQAERCRFSGRREFENFKRRLVAAVSVVLKYDWERSKAEIKGSTKLRFVIAVYVSFGILATLAAAPLFKNQTALNLLLGMAGGMVMKVALFCVLFKAIERFAGGFHCSNMMIRVAYSFLFIGLTGIGVFDFIAVNDHVTQFIPILENMGREKYEAWLISAFHIIPDFTALLGCVVHMTALVSNRMEYYDTIRKIMR